MLQPVATDGLFAAADSGTATPQQSDNGTNNHADNTAYVGEHVMASTTAKSHGKAARIAIITIFAVLLAALIAYFFVGRWYFQDKAAPGVHLGNVSVMGQTREELANTVKQRLNNTTVTFTAEGNSVKASLKDLGVTVDTDKTVDALLNAKTGDVAKLNIFDQPHIALTATTDKETAEQFVTAGLVDEADRAQIATVVYNKSTKQFDYTAGQDGKGPDTNVVNAAVKEAVATPGENATVPVKLQTAKNPIDDASAQQTQFDANARLGLKLTVDNGVNKSVTIPADTIASFLKPTVNKAGGTMSLVVDRDAITKYVTSDSVTKELTVPKVTREVYITPKDEGGVEIGADKTLGVDGIEVTGAGDAPERLATAIEQNQSTDSTVAVKDSPYDVKQVEVPHNFDTANGDKWVHVDLTNQTATAYQGTTVVRSSTSLLASPPPMVPCCPIPARSTCISSTNRRPWLAKATTSQARRGFPTITAARPCTVFLHTCGARTPSMCSRVSQARTAASTCRWPTPSGCTTLPPSALVWSLMAPHRLPVRRCARLVRMPPDGRAATPADSIHV